MKNSFEYTKNELRTH